MLKMQRNGHNVNIEAFYKAPPLAFHVKVDVWHCDDRFELFLTGRDRRSCQLSGEIVK